MAMEELHAAALAYYDNGTQEVWDRARSFFQSMDTNGDGKISCLEFNDFLQQSGYGSIINDPYLFSRLDRNGDGGLDFGEVLTFYYIIKTRNIRCQGNQCGVHLYGLYFTCVACFDRVHEHLCTFDLCPACYRNRNYYHHHQHPTYFLDNHVLLRSKRGLYPYTQPDLNMAITPPPPPAVYNNINYYIAAAPQRNRWFNAFRAFEAVLAAASVAANCTIM